MAYVHGHFGSRLKILGVLVRSAPEKAAHLLFMARGGSGPGSARGRNNPQRQYELWLRLLLNSLEWHFRHHLGLPQLRPHSPFTNGELIAWALTTLDELGEPWEGDIPEWE